MAEGALKTKFDAVVIGGSAGSLEAIVQIVEGLTKTDFAIIIVLHRKVTYDSVLAGIISGRTSYTVKEAEEKEMVMKGSIYLAPPDYHLLVEKDRSLSLDVSEKVNFSRPSIDVTFESAAEVYGRNLIAILLSGGNWDGVEGMKEIKKKGGLCIVQNPVSATVAIMPAQAVAEIKVDYVLNPHEIAAFLNDL